MRAPSRLPTCAVPSSSSVMIRSRTPGCIRNDGTDTLMLWVGVSPSGSGTAAAKQCNPWVASCSSLA
jgi:hypothetical protein